MRGTDFLEWTEDGTAIVCKRGYECKSHGGKVDLYDEGDEALVRRNDEEALLNGGRYKPPGGALDDANTIVQSLRVQR